MVSDIQNIFDQLLSVAPYLHSIQSEADYAAALQMLDELTDADDRYIPLKLLLATAIERWHDTRPSTAALKEPRISPLR